MTEPVLELLEWEPQELHLFRPDHAELHLQWGRELKILTLFDAANEVLIRILNGFDVVQIFDRDRDDGFHRDFSRYRLVCHIQDDATRRTSTDMRSSISATWNRRSGRPLHEQRAVKDRFRPAIWATIVAIRTSCIGEGHGTGGGRRRAR